MKPGTVWIIEYKSELYGWVQTTYWYTTKKIAEIQLKDERDVYPERKLRVQRYVRITT